MQTKGYCSDVLTDETIKFIRKNQEGDSVKPFFDYLSFNATHNLLQLPVEYYNIYEELEFIADSFGVYDEVVEEMSEREIEATRKVYGGGVRVPCLIHYPAKFKEKEVINATLAHIDLLPSILDLCGVKKPAHKIDGISVFTENNENKAALEKSDFVF